MTKYMHHGFCNPVRLKNIIRFFFCSVTFHHTFLIYVWNRIEGSERSGKIFKCPLGSAREPGHYFLLFQMPVNQVTDIGFIPISIFRKAGCCNKQRVICFFITTVSYLPEKLIWFFSIASCITITAPFYMQEMIDFLHFGS